VRFSDRGDCAPRAAPPPTLPPPPHAPPAPPLPPILGPVNSAPKPSTRSKPIRAKSWALKKLTEAVRTLIDRKLAKCAPEAFRMSCPQRPEQQPAAADYGLIQFSGGGVKVPAHWLHLADCRAPYRTSKKYASEVLDLMEKYWGMSPASVLISITGGAQDLQQAQVRPK
jgi:hypothetical protein